MAVTSCFLLLTDVCLFGCFAPASKRRKEPLTKYHSPTCSKNGIHLANDSTVVSEAMCSLLPFLLPLVTSQLLFVTYIYWNIFFDQIFAKVSFQMSFISVSIKFLNGLAIQDIHIADDKFIVKDFKILTFLLQNDNM